MIRVLLVDDQALIRSGIRSLLEAEEDIEVVAEGSDGQQAVALAREHRPKVILAGWSAYPRQLDFERFRAEMVPILDKRI